MRFGTMRSGYWPIGCANMAMTLPRSDTMSTPNARAFRSIIAFGSKRAVIFTTLSMLTAVQATIPHAGRINCSPSRSIIRRSIQNIGVRCSTSWKKKLVTPVGLRTLSPDDPNYKPIYAGDLRSRDGAYHQGTVWAWLIGPFIDAWLKVHPHDRAAGRKFLETFPVHLSDNGVGTISEVFDASEPHMAGGCIAQAWSVAEVLRAWLETA